MKNKVTLLVLAIIAIVITIGQVQGDSLTNSKAIVKIDSSNNVIDYNRVSDASVVNIATTTLYPISAISNRDRLMIRVNSATSTDAVWVNLGSELATVSEDIMVIPSVPLDIELGPDVEAALIASEAFEAVIIQTVRE